MIFGENDAVLVDAMTTVAEAEALAAWIALHNRNLQTIHITHAHFDHFYGLSILLERFPDARALATPATLNAMQMSRIIVQGRTDSPDSTSLYVPSIGPSVTSKTSIAYREPPGPTRTFSIR